MTAKEFESYFRHKYRSDDKSAYFRCALITFVGILLYIKLPSDNIALIISSVPVALSIFMAWRISKRHVIKEIDSTVSIQRKVEILESFADTYKYRLLARENDMYVVCTIKFFLIEVDVYAHFSDEKIFLYAGNDAPKGEVLDAGISRRTLNRVHKHFIKHLQ